MATLEHKPVIRWTSVDQRVQILTETTYVESAGSIDDMDVEASRRSVAWSAASGEPNVPAEDLFAELGL